MTSLVKILLTIATIFFMVVFVAATLFVAMVLLLADFEWDSASSAVVVSFLLLNLLLSLFARYLLSKYRIKYG